MTIPFVKDQHAAVEALKEFARLVLIAAVSAGIAAGTAALSLIHDPIILAALTTLLTFIGKAWDKYVHKSDANGITTGLTGF